MPVCWVSYEQCVQTSPQAWRETHEAADCRYSQENRRRRKTEFCIPKNEKDQKHHSWKCNSATAPSAGCSGALQDLNTEERRSEDEGSNCRRRLFWRFHTRLSFKCGAAETHLSLISKHRRRAQVKDAPSFLSLNTKHLM